MSATIHKLKQQTKEVASSAYKQAKKLERKGEKFVENKLSSNGSGRKSGAKNKKNENRPRSSPSERSVNHRRQRGGSRGSPLTPIGSMTRGTRIGENKFSTQGSSLLLHRREFLGEVLGNTVWTARMTELITPTNVNLMRWASQISVLFETFQYVSMSWHFRTNSGMVTTAQNQGNVEMVVVYDADDPALANVNSFMNYSGAVMGLTYKDLSLHLNPDDAMFKKMYINHGTVDDLTSPGKFQMAVSGQIANNAMIGYLYVDYTIRLGIPRASPETLWNTRHMSGKKGTTWDYLASTTSSAAVVSNILWAGWPMCDVYKVNNSLNFYFSSEGRYDIRVSLSTSNTTHAGTITASHDTSLGGLFSWSTFGALNNNQKCQSASGTMWATECQLQVKRGVNNPLSDGHAAHFYVQFSGTSDATVINITVSVIAVDLDFVTASTPRLGKDRGPTAGSMNALERRIMELENRARALGSKDSTDDYTPAGSPDYEYREMPSSSSSSSSSTTGSHKREGRMLVAR